MSNNKNIKKNIVKITSIILCFLLSTSLLMTVLFVSIGANLSHKSLNKYIVLSGYSRNLSDKISDKLYNIADINHIPHEIFDDFVDSSFMTNDIYEYIIAMSENNKDNKNIIKLNNKKEELAEKIKNYALNNMELTEGQMQNLDKNTDELVDECVLIYQNNMKSVFLEKLYDYSNILNKYFILISVTLILIDAVIYVTLIFIQKWKHRGYRYNLYSLTSCEIVMVVSVLYLLVNNIINRLAIVSKELYNFVVVVLNGVLGGIYIFIIVFAILIALTAVLYKSKKNNVM